MMSEPTTVDRTTVDELTGKLVLVIEEDRPWRETDLMHRQLSAKVKHYVRYVRSKEFAREHGQRPEDTIVRLVNAQAPGEDSLSFFERIGYELSKHGIDFEHQVGQDGIPVSLSPGVVAPEADAPTAVPTLEKPAAEPPPAELEPEAPQVEAAGAEVEAAAGSAEPAPAEAEASEEPLSEAAEPAETAASAEVPPSFVRPEELETAVPHTVAGAEPPVPEEPSELELLIESPGDDELDFVEPEEVSEPMAVIEPLSPPPASKPKYAPFFPEEEFGRAVPDMEEVEAILGGAGAEPAVIETASGEMIRLDVSDTAEKAARGQAGPSLLRGAGAAVIAALVGAVVWTGLSLAAGRGASPLALAVALMVGVSVRLRGNGHTLPFRLVGVCGTLLGSLVGAVLAAAALSAWQEGRPIAGFAASFVASFSGPGRLWGAMDQQYQALDLASLALALYIAFKLSASKPSS
jgi:hypothetical protein